MKPAPRPPVKLPGPSCLEHRVEHPCPQCERIERVLDRVMAGFMYVLIVALVSFVVAVILRHLDR
jgi:hypothetical protein